MTAELTSVWDEVGVTWFNRLQWNGARSQAEKANNGAPKPSEYGPLFEYKNVITVVVLLGIPSSVGSLNLLTV